MYDNILHKPLVMRPGASTTAWSLLQGLLEKEGAYRLGSRDDFVSGRRHWAVFLGLPLLAVSAKC